MDIFKILRLEHVVARGLLKEIIDQTTLAAPKVRGDTYRRLVRNLKIMLHAHNRAEEDVFYEALREIAHQPAMADTKSEEHHLGEKLLEDLEKMNPHDKKWDTQLFLLKNQIESHIAEEETLVFTVLESKIDDDVAEELAANFEVLRTDIMRSSKAILKESTRIDRIEADF